MRALIYTRQSVEREGGEQSLSLESQRSALEGRCAAEGWTVIDVIADAGLKGWMDETERPGLDRCIRRAEAGDYDVLLVWDISRLARSVRIQEDLIFRLARANVRVVSHTEPHAADDLIRVILGAINQRQTMVIGRNIQNALHHRVRQGLHNGRLPWGYRKPDKNQPLVIDDAIAPHVRRIYALRREGWTARRIATELDRRGVQTPSGLSFWREATVRAILANPVYRGATAFGALLIEECHPAIVTPADWHAAQRPYGALTRAPKGEPQTWLAGRVAHACGAPMYVVAYADQRRPPALGCRLASTGRHHGGEARCGVRPATVSLERAETLAWTAVVDALAHLLPLDAVLERADAAYRHAEPGAAKVRTALQERRGRLLASRRRVEELYVGGVRERAWFDAEDAMLSANLVQVDADLAALPAAPDHAAIAANVATLHSLAAAAEVIEGMDRANVLAELGRIVIEPTEAIPAGRKPQGRWRARLEVKPEYEPMLSARPVEHRVNR